MKETQTYEIMDLIWIQIYVKNTIHDKRSSKRLATEKEMVQIPDEPPICCT